MVLTIISIKYVCWKSLEAAQNWWSLSAVVGGKEPSSLGFLAMLCIQILHSVTLTFALHIAG